MSFLTLPSELIEAVLVSSSSPRTVANVAQTSRALRAIVYASPDSHLWRELFLTIWDDPRPALEHRSQLDSRIRPDLWDWGVQYRQRVLADRWLKAWRRDVCLADQATAAAPTDLSDVGLGDSSQWHAATLSALSATLSTLLTLSPFPVTPPIALTVITPSSSRASSTISGPGIPPTYANRNATVAVSAGGNRWEQVTSAPPLPPLLIVLASGFSAFKSSSSAKRLGRMAYGPHALLSSTATNQLPIPLPSLPPQLVRTLLASHEVGVQGLQAYKPRLLSAEESAKDVMADMFHRIVCITGFVPVPSPLVSVTSPVSVFEDYDVSTVPLSLEETEEGLVAQAEEEGEDEEEEEEEDEEISGDHSHESEDHEMTARHNEPEAFPTPEEQYADARTLARRRVYDMRYLRADRLWGPFQPVTRASVGVKPEGGPTERERTGATSWTRVPRRAGIGISTLAYAMGLDVDPEDDQDSSSDADNDQDPDWHDSADNVGKAPVSSVNRAGPVPQEDMDGSSDGDTDIPTEPEHPLISLLLASTGPTVQPASSTGAPSSRRMRRSNPRLPPNSLLSPRDIRPEHLRPDYTYLASVRIVVEANLRDLFGSEATSDYGSETVTEQDRPGGVGMFWEDEDEVMRAQDTYSPGPVTPPCHTTPAAAGKGADSHTLDLGEILSRFRNLEVARSGSACGYWSSWIERHKREMEGVVDGTTQSSSSSALLSTALGNVDTRMRKPRIVTERSELDKSSEDTGAIDGGDKIKGRGKGKEKEKTRHGIPTSPPPADVPESELGDWEVGPEGEACEGWDWVGVAGIWRRCVCWMDYRELLFFNLDCTKFLTVDTQEACRIIPMELRITGYTRAGLMPIHGIDIDIERDGINVLTSGHGRVPAGPVPEGYFRPPPVIHFTGSSVGSDRSLDEGRTVRGTIQMIGGGEVRWQMDTYAQGSGSSSPEWSSEAVQVGGPGSAIGWLGMWTGAGHERADPLGPFWAWKVA